MLHKLTIGNLDPATVQERRVVVTRPLDLGIVERLLVNESSPPAGCLGQPNIKPAYRTFQRLALSEQEWAIWL